MRRSFFGASVASAGLPLYAGKVSAASMHTTPTVRHVTVSHSLIILLMHLPRVDTQSVGVSAPRWGRAQLEPVATTWVAISSPGDSQGDSARLAAPGETGGGGIKRRRLAAPLTSVAGTVFLYTLSKVGADYQVTPKFTLR